MPPGLSAGSRVAGRVLAGIRYRVRILLLVMRLLTARLPALALPFRSRARSDRSGAQIHDDLMALAFCHQRGLPYGGSVGEDHFEEHRSLCLLLGLPAPRRRGSWSLLGAYYRERWPWQPPPVPSCLGPLLPSPYSLEAADIFTPPVLSHLRANCPLPQQPFRGRRVVLHMRRGDVNPIDHPDRYVPNSTYRHILITLNTLLSHPEFVIHTQSPCHEPLEEFEQEGAIVQRDTPLAATWQEMIEADILVLSRSSFSYVPALYNPNIILYMPFWHARLDHWIDITSGDWPQRVCERIGQLQRHHGEALHR